MNNNIILHIGFGRTSTTTLQTNIYNLLAKLKNINYLYCKELKIKNGLVGKTEDDNLDLDYKLYLSEIEKIKKLNNNDILLSDESLISYRNFCPSTYEKRLKKSLDYFGREAKVIISIRKPSEWLSSIYDMWNNGKSVEEFFLDKEKFENTSYSEKFLIENFNFENIINKYKKNFKDLYIVKYEEIENFNFLKNLFELKLDEVDALKEKYSTTITSARHNYFRNKLNLMMNIMEERYSFKKFFNIKKKLTTNKYNINFDNLKVNIDELDRNYKFIKSN
jgi:hypothetical protein